MVAEPTTAHVATAATRSREPAVSSSRWWFSAALGVFVVAAGLRVAAARGELWLDEVWSILLVETGVKSPIDVVYRLRHDNNHFLNSWVAYSRGSQAPDWQYRAPAVAGGIAAVVLAAWAQWRLGPPVMFAAASLVGLSYLMVHYSSEARGYAYLCSFLLLAYGALVRAEETGRTRWEMLIAASCSVGFLAHPLFLTMFLAIQVWTWLPDGKPMDRFAARRLALAALFRTLLPGLFFAWLYWVNLRRLQIGGGDPQPYGSVVLQTLSLAFGGGFKPPASYIAACISLLLTATALVHLMRQSPRRAAFYATAIFLVPATLLVVSPRSDIYPRYFLASVLLLYLLWSELLGEVFQKARRGQLLYGAVLVAFAVSNFVHIAQLIMLGRSHYREAIELVERETAGPQINLAADHGFRHRQMFDYLSRQIRLEKPLAFDPRDPAAVAKAEWFFTHNLDPTAAAPLAIRLNELHDFELVESFPFAGLSGWQLNVYRRRAASVGPVAPLRSSSTDIDH